jgi:hypothetical protein
VSLSGLDHFRRWSTRDDRERGLRGVRVHQVHLVDPDRGDATVFDQDPLLPTPARVLQREIQSERIGLERSVERTDRDLHPNLEFGTIWVVGGESNSGSRRSRSPSGHVDGPIESLAGGYADRPRRGHDVDKRPRIHLHEPNGAVHGRPIVHGDDPLPRVVQRDKAKVDDARNLQPTARWALQLGSGVAAASEKTNADPNPGLRTHPKVDVRPNAVPSKKERIQHPIAGRSNVPDRVGRGDSRKEGSSRGRSSRRVDLPRFGGQVLVLTRPSSIDPDTVDEVLQKPLTQIPIGCTHCSLRLATSEQLVILFG